MSLSSPILLVCTILVLLLICFIDLAIDLNNKEIHDDGKEPFEIHNHTSQQQSQQIPHQQQQSPQQQPTAISHPVLHPGLSRPHHQTTTIQRPPPPPNTLNHPGKETRPSVIESSQPHIIECT